MIEVKEYVGKFREGKIDFIGGVVILKVSLKFSTSNMISSITREKFRPFGRVIEYPNKNQKGKKRNLWKIVLTDPDARGWRIAYLIVRDKKLRRLERHVKTFESFESVRGRAILLVSQRPDVRGIRAFYLTKPVILRKGIWHAVLSLTRETEIKITENAKVTCQYWALPRSIVLRNGKIK